MNGSHLQKQLCMEARKVRWCCKFMYLIFLHVYDFGNGMIMFISAKVEVDAHELQVVDVML